MELRKGLLMGKAGLPSEYQQVEYLKSTGVQYIDTGIQLGSNDFEIKCDFERTNNTTQE